ncbi:hypothetical protein REPUB_Repub09cG0107700 [Reevesia pubescens]
MIRILKTPKPLTTLSHQLLQRCSVSGTSKEKSKLKVGQPLKCSKISIKKGKGGPATDDSLPEGSQIPDEKQRLYNQYLNAPSLIRYLSAKERAHEAKWEKLGLISKIWRWEMKILKKEGRKSLEVPDEPMIMGTPGLDLITLGLVDANKIPKYELTVEDGRRLAIEALSEKLKEAALIPDLTPSLANRLMASLTLPIKGYIEKVKEVAKKSSAK